MSFIELKNVCKQYPNTDKKAVTDFNLEIDEKEFIAFVGPSGCGKSTTLRMIAGFEEISGGDLYIAGKRMNEVAPRDRGISMVFQNYALFRYMTVYDNVAFGLKVQKVDKKKIHARVMELVKLVGLEGLEKRYPSQLSGGQRQRVMIAMALVCKPEILIADEPTTALDVTIQAQILDLMNQLKKETGTSILFITHDLGVVAEVCDDVAVMYCGRVVERGDVKSIFANPSHPYTKGLLGSIPRLGDAGKELNSIPGNVPNPKYMPKGCKFAPRCPYASEKCREAEPGFFQIGEGHISRCWLCESGQLKTDHVEKAGD